MEEIDGVVNVVPVPIADPPVDEAYQLMVPPLEVADKVKVPASHLLAPVTLLMLGVEVTLAVTVVRVELVQVAVAASTK